MSGKEEWGGSQATGGYCILDMLGKNLKEERLKIALEQHHITIVGTKSALSFFRIRSHGIMAVVRALSARTEVEQQTQELQKVESELDTFIQVMGIFFLGDGHQSDRLEPRGVPMDDLS